MDDFDRSILRAVAHSGPDANPFRILTAIDFPQKERLTALNRVVYRLGSLEFAGFVFSRFGFVNQRPATRLYTITPEGMKAILDQDLGSGRELFPRRFWGAFLLFFLVTEALLLWLMWRS